MIENCKTSWHLKKFNQAFLVVSIYILTVDQWPQELKSLKGWKGMASYLALQYWWIWGWKYLGHFSLRLILKESLEIRRWSYQTCAHCQVRPSTQVPTRTRISEGFEFALQRQAMWTWSQKVIVLLLFNSPKNHSIYMWGCGINNMSFGRFIGVLLGYYRWICVAIC